ncbi:hypothetical protein R3P38DRAFT_3311637 [Favolaschia claudopus]|uniref:Uncharacterized protein n=1 Tax=Favolaschia claudopus TaxID=2862362 RepID=A0AAW0CFM2_9AGAR
MDPQMMGISKGIECEDAGIKPGLPHTKIFRSIAPDVLHQLYQGIVKHLIAWLKTVCGEAEIDARCRRLPPNHNIRLFMNGISDLNRVTGKEHDQISRFILGIIVDIQLPNNLKSSLSLTLLEDALHSFHGNKSIFVDLGVRPDFNLPKLHNSSHTPSCIEYFGTTDNYFGTTDNYNTEYTERFHIDLAKDAYRSTNFKDEFPQMTLWLERKEKIFRHEKYIQWRLDGCPPPATLKPLPPSIVYERRLKMTKHPTLKAALSRFVVQFKNPTFTRAQIEAQSHSIPLQFNRVPVYHRLKFVAEDPYTVGRPEDSVIDSIHVQPRSGKELSGRFDTAIINDGSGGLTGVDGYRVGQVRVIFSLKPDHIRSFFGNGVSPPQHLAYVEWFSPFTSQPEPHHLMYKVRRSLKDGIRSAGIVPVANIRRSVHLLPKFGPVAPSHWTSANVLEECPAFFVNCFSDRHIYTTLY